MRQDRNLVFFDTETTGINLEFDQIVQFAAILTTPSLKELDRFELRCRRLPWVVPSPGAMIVTGNLPETLDDTDLLAYPEMMSLVHRKLSEWSPAIFMGYNSVRFDEPLVQRAFWQNLLPPYLTVTRGNSRSDLLSLVRVCAKIAAHALKIPNAASGKPLFKLDRLAPLNGFAHANAHDALGDVEATIHIAKIIQNRVPKLWAEAISSSDKTNSRKILDGQEPVLIMDTSSSKAIGWWALPIGRVQGHSSAHLLVRLENAQGAILESDAQKLKLWMERSPQPVRKVSSNRGILMLTINTAKERFGISPSKAELEVGLRIRENEKWREEIIQLYPTTERDRVGPRAIEQRIFESFPSAEDERLMEDFHNRSWKDRAPLVRQFEDDRLQQLAQRLIYLMAPETLKEDALERVRTGILQRLNSTEDDTSPWRSISQARAELEEFSLRNPNSPAVTPIESFLNRLQDSPDLQR